MTTTTDGRQIGWLAVKQEYVLPPEPAEERQDDKSTSKKRKRGQNQHRKHTNLRETKSLCPQYAQNIPCKFGDSCKFCHSLEEYMAQKEEDIGDVCPVYEAIGVCRDGWRCRWLSGHIRKAEPGEEDAMDGWKIKVDEEKVGLTVYEELNRVKPDDLRDFKHGKIPLPKTVQFIKHLEPEERTMDIDTEDQEHIPESEQDGTDEQALKTHRATFVESPLRPTEKRRINWSGLHVLAPLTTIGNPPFRRLLRAYGAQLTYSEMALSTPLLQSQKTEWALVRAHPSESSRHTGPERASYGVQIAGSKVANVVKTTELLTQLCATGLDTIDLNCGCPLDMVYKTGAGSGLLDQQGKLVKMLRGMVLVSGDIPVTCKIRMGVQTGKNTAQKLLKKIIVENVGISAITLHGRSRQQRYTKAADWAYIAECAALIKRTKEEMAAATDASYENLEVGETVGRLAFLGNGDVNSFVDWERARDIAGCDTSMIARGAIIKPWIFEEIEARQHLDKSASERLDMLKKFAYWGLEHWGSDTYGLSKTRRFFCEFMSFFHRYVPLGILEAQSIPPHLHNRAPRWCGRSDLETLLGSKDSSDWIKVSEMFLGKTPEGWSFTPKHKSNSVDAEG